MSRACLSLGSNVDPERHVALAFDALRARFGDILASRAYRTPAIGFEGPDFVNAAAVIETDLDVHALNLWLHVLEDAHGRDRGGPRYGDRTLDIDIVLFDDLVCSGPGNLRLPRGELRHAFVLRPLAEIAPDVVEPVAGLTLAALWAASPERDVAMHPVALPALQAAAGDGHTPPAAAV
ncbi:2-amino-4-hydroxy-6-hydroxymethyldihydropteridine diphosphokinase [Luteimonas sp. MC1782]|uniref:2-amino-4-hydroxy-6- hydroxymethyldihydropteridine diphosphokinase n=1 Tax=Luteimonas sp. MC1782 TaxID=2760305 RepID=UPI001601D054|nr:2-amino-4-hydroxy-6-hydroxymethyldihydropteridine diphosphokinase [Luteimonas sp. MC1782]MBB1473081.1 2-amino-4-hydroxy-6-hydroxymethyldihydropteridine diphosphokinase [Luteimonas sp. MC1782]